MKQGGKAPLYRTAFRFLRHINLHNDTIVRAFYVPTMESDDLGLVVNMVDMDALPAQTTRHARPASSQSDQVPIHIELHSSIGQGQ